MPHLSTRLYRARRALFWSAFGLIALTGLLALSLPSTWEGGVVPAFFPDRVLSLVLLFLGETPEGISSGRSWLFPLAHLSAIMFTFTAVLELVSSVFTQLWGQYVVRRHFRRHRIICGLSRKGIRLARVFRDAGHQVILVERDPEHVEIEVMRGEGFRVHIGDGVSPRVLLDAGVEGAHSVYLACPDDDNLRILRALEGLAKRRRARRFPTCHVHIWDRKLYDELQYNDVASRRQGKRRRMQVHYHSVAALAGAKLLDWMPEKGTPTPPLLSGNPEASDHFVVIGVGATGFEFIVGTARRWANTMGRQGHRIAPTFHLVDQRAEEWEAELQADNPALAPHWNLVAHTMEVPSASFTRLFSKPADGSPFPIPQPRRILVALTSDAANVVVGLSLLRRMPALNWWDTLVVARIAEEKGVMWCDALNNNTTPLFRQFQPFNQLKEVLTVDFFRNAPSEQIAIALHEAYRRQVESENQERVAKGLPRFTPIEKPADVEWEVLAEGYRESSRLQAAGIVLELASLAAPREVVLGPGKGDPLTPEELEFLAMREHDRWMADRASQGWRYGAKRDNEQKFHPDMVGWDELSETSKDYDRKMVAAWPEALKRAGLIVRLKG